MDLPLAGDKFTWFRGGSQVAASRIDHILVSPEILNWFPNVIQTILPRNLSHHKPIVLREQVNKSKNKPFKIFTHWLNYPELTDLIKKSLEAAACDGMEAFLSTSKSAIKRWGSNFRALKEKKMQNIDNKIEELEQQLCRSGPDQNCAKDLQNLKHALWEKYRREEREWHQKSRVKWFNEGDKNTNFFHISAPVRRCRNRIVSLESRGKVITDQQKLERECADFFHSHYNSSNIVPIKRFDCELSKMSEASVKWLEAPFTEKEIWETVRNMDGSRASSPDGFNLDFYKKFWASLKKSVLKFFEDFYECRIEEKDFNRSYIALIPKKDNPTSIGDYRPISLIESLFKILAKVWSKRLTGCIQEVVGENQFAFTPGKQISDCVLIANEVIDEIKRRRDKVVVVKADFKRAYDTVDWAFLDLILDKMGFGTKWRKWITICLSTAKISDLVNGFPSRFFSIRRGLRQGCPLSPYLFNIFGEALSSLIKAAVQRGYVCGAKIGTNGISVSHLQFADDLILFAKVEKQQIINIKRLLRVFEMASGLTLNLKKTSFSELIQMRVGFVVGQIQ
ncbi:hypothetical protein HRI_004012700 [Hibiscus trionum]|uniref:Reverse transcriptase domain-containing protein n=1 Tax=Hibiscus trionum TaxID=183268 RepID=A0A9W7IWW8_HIBTR|nr:hypothetical protein HRI_004012700 [Hibiscus trionum]